MSYLENKVALITGGGTGIGRSTALLFAKEGADVAVNYSRSQSDAEATAEDVRKLGRKAIAVQANVADDPAVRTMVDRVASEFGRLDILVNNAGTTRFVPLAELDELTGEDWDTIMDVNVKGTFFCSRAAIAKMREHDGGVIINIASIAGRSGQGSSVAYCASKAAIINMTKSLAFSQAPDIRVNAISPGLVDTRWVADQRDFFDMHRDATPLNRVASPDDIAAAIFSLVIAEFVTGENLTVDGGRLL
jgi:3-oxoacyl-[acyl-carrier protein] reductase